MVFQGHLFILLIAVAVFSYLSRQTYMVEVCGRQEKRYGRLPAMVIAVVLIWLAATRPDSIGDTGVYRASFLAAPASLSQIPAAVASSKKDDGFTVFNILVKCLIGNNDVIYFGVIAAICILCVVTFYRRHSCNFIMSMFLFIASSDYVQWTHNGMRQFIAVSVIFLATELLLRKRYVAYYTVILLMATIHASALIMIPVSLVVQGRAWNLRTVLFTLGALIAINFSGGLRGLIVDFMEETQYSGEVNQFLSTTGTNIFRVLVFCIPPVLALVFRRYLDYANDPLLNIAANMSIVSMGIYIVSAVTSGLFVGRIPIFFSLHNYILLPWLVENIFEKRSSRLVYGALIICYLAFYYYQIEVTWGF